MKFLDVEAVQAFVLVADLRSFTRAADAMDTTQSAISGRIRRLEQTLGHRVLERTPRRVQLSEQGQAFLEPARQFLAAHRGAFEAVDAPPRRLVLGISHHIVGAELPALLASLRQQAPRLRIELHVTTSRAALDAFDRGQVHAALVLAHDHRRQDGEAIHTERFGWMAAPGFAHTAGEPLPLATQPEPCSVRQMATGALAQAGIAWTEVFVGGGVMTIGAAVSSGMAVAALARRVAPVGTVDVGARFGLPPLPARDVVLYANASDRDVRAALKRLATAFPSASAA